MLAIHARHAIQKTTLQTQGNWSARGLFDGVTGLGNVDFFDRLPSHLATGGFVAQVGDKPTMALENDLLCRRGAEDFGNGTTYQTVATPYLGLARTVGP